jgi:hypothetical protein
LSGRGVTTRLDPTPPGGQPQLQDRNDFLDLFTASRINSRVDFPIDT